MSSSEDERQEKEERMERDARWAPTHTRWDLVLPLIRGHVLHLGTFVLLCGPAHKEGHGPLLLLRLVGSKIIQDLCERPFTFTFVGL